MGTTTRSREHPSGSESILFFVNEYPSPRYAENISLPAIIKVTPFTYNFKISVIIDIYKDCVAMTIAIGYNILKIGKVPQK